MEKSFIRKVWRETIKLKLINRGLSGTVQVIGDKSISHRAILFSALAEVTSVIKNLLISEDTKASLEIIVLAICTFSIGVFYHFASDMQKFIFLKYQSGLITDGFWKQCRHPNYFGELLIYLSFVIMVIETPLWWLPTMILTLFIVAVWIPNMIKIDRSLSRFEEHESYKKKTAFIIPYIL